MNKGNVVNFMSSDKFVFVPNHHPNITTKKYYERKFSFISILKIYFDILVINVKVFITINSKVFNLDF